MFVVFLAVADEDVVFETGQNRRHNFVFKGIRMA